MSDADPTYPCSRRAFLSAAGCAVYAVLAGSRRDPGFMRADPRGRRVELTIIAALDASNTGFNFNGGSHGGHRITVPTGWEVRVAFVNRDVIRHSVIVVREETPLPMRFSRPEFPGAVSRAPQRGLPPGGEDHFAFRASTAGSYVIACGVPGHAALGTYVRLSVSSDATRPVYAMS